MGYSLLMANLYLVNFRDGSCNDLHAITDAEWEHDWDTGGSRLRVLDTAPAKCWFPLLLAREMPEFLLGIHETCQATNEIPF